MRAVVAGVAKETRHGRRDPDPALDMQPEWRRLIDERLSRLLERYPALIRARDTAGDGWPRWAGSLLDSESAHASCGPGELDRGAGARRLYLRPALAHHGRSACDAVGPPVIRRLRAARSRHAQLVRRRRRGPARCHAVRARVTAARGRGHARARAADARCRPRPPRAPLPDCEAGPRVPFTPSETSGINRLAKVEVEPLGSRNGRGADPTHDGRNDVGPRREPPDKQPKRRGEKIFGVEHDVVDVLGTDRREGHDRISALDREAREPGALAPDERVLLPPRRLKTSRAPPGKTMIHSPARMSARTLSGVPLTTPKRSTNVRHAGTRKCRWSPTVRGNTPRASYSSSNRSGESNTPQVVWFPASRAGRSMGRCSSPDTRGAVIHRHGASTKRTSSMSAVVGR